MADKTPDTTPDDAARLAAEHKKDELVAAAAVQGVEVPSGATKADIAEAIVAQPAAKTVTVNNYTRRSDEDAVEGAFVDVVAGPYAGRFGSFRQALEHNKVTGYPSKILVRTRDELNDLIEVAYEHVRPSKRTGGR